MTCGVCTYQWCWVCNGDYFYTHCDIKRGYDALIPSGWDGFKALLLFSLFVIMTPMILCAGAPLAVIVVGITIFYEYLYEINSEGCELPYTLIALPWMILTVCLTLAFQVYVMVLAILAAPVLMIASVNDFQDGAISDILAAAENKRKA